MRYGSHTSGKVDPTNCIECRTWQAAQQWPSTAPDVPLDAERYRLTQANHLLHTLAREAAIERRRGGSCQLGDVREVVDRGSLTTGRER